MTMKKNKLLLLLIFNLFLTNIFSKDFVWNVYFENKPFGVGNVVLIRSDKLKERVDFIKEHVFNKIPLSYEERDSLNNCLIFFDSGEFDVSRYATTFKDGLDYPLVVFHSKYLYGVDDPNFDWVCIHELIHVIEQEPESVGHNGKRADFLVNLIESNFDIDLYYQ